MTPISLSLTARQQSVLDLISESVQTKGYPPSIRELCDALDISSPNGIACHLKALEKKGLLIRSGGKSRTIQLVNQPSPTRMSFGGTVR